jgi:hypothetical protein
MKKSKNMLKHIASILVVGIFLILAVASGSDEQQSQTGTNLNFEQIGYYKGEKKLRYFTFYVKSSESLSRDSLSEEIFEELKKHGSKQMNTSGQITASFYYLDRNSAPDITNLDAQRANDLAHDRKPVAAIWIMPSGQINLIKNTE